MSEISNALYFSIPFAVSQKPPEIVCSIPGVPSHSDLPNKELDKFDVVICGGARVIFIGIALKVKGLRVGILERNELKGREQEWNISRKELLELVDAGILTEDDIEQATAAKFNPVSSSCSGIIIFSRCLLL